MGEDTKDGLEAAVAALKPEIREMLAEDLPQDRHRIQDAAAAGQWEQVRELVHQVKGSASFCRLQDLRQLCEEIESGLKAGTPPPAAIMAAFSQEVDRVLAALGARSPA